MTFYSAFIKRIIDIILSILALVVLGIPMLIIALLIRINMGAPVLYKAERIGMGEKAFTLLKFRSMRDAVDSNGIPLPDSERLTGLGRLIRKLSIDELPSLLNIIRGDMAIIGPRPLPMVYLPWFTKEERIRHTVRGGLSGLAQVSGRNGISWEKKFAYDIQYVENISFLQDIKLVILSFVVAFQCKDVGERGDANSNMDFDCYRSGLTEEELDVMQKNGELPKDYETWCETHNGKGTVHS